MAFVKNKLDILCKKLSEQSRKLLFPVELEVVPAPYKKGHTPPADGWKHYENEELYGYDEHYWFRGTFTTPKVEAGKQLMLRAITGYEGQWDAGNPQGLLYLNGKMVQGYDTNHTEAYLEPETTYEMVNYFYIGLIHTPVKLKMYVEELDTALEQLYYDVKVPLESAKLLDENSDEYQQIIPVLEMAANLIDMRKVYSKEYYESIAAAEQFLQEEFYGKVCTTAGKPVVNCFGHTHIDVEWHWHRAQTREKMQRSFATASNLMQHYPEYKFMLSQPELYRYLKEEAPEKYAELKQYVAEGRWEPEGAMWLEADTNLTAGESLIRQIMHGKKFFKDEFGVDNKILFLPDVFGYSAALPQILKKCGVEYFITTKISWNETNTFPNDTFYWQGIDGSEVLADFITTQNYTGPEPSRGTTYVGSINPSQVKGNRNRYMHKEYTDETLFSFGFGDGGGGPNRDMLEQQRRLAKGIPGMPVTKIGFVLPYMEKLEKDFTAGCKKYKKTPRWVGEMYLEFHRGTYTSMARNKRGNRKSELGLQKAEALSYIDLRNGGTYDQEGINKIWKKVLHDQFHDILPGSSNFEIYEGTDKDYALISAFCKEKEQEKLQAIAQNVQSDGGLLVYNALGFAAKGMVKNAQGQTVEVGEIPAFGWKTVPDAAPACKVKIDGLTAENDFYVMQLDEAGRMVKLYDKRAQRDVFVPGEKGNEIQVFEDFPREYDNWEITDYYKQKMWVLDQPISITPVFDGSRAGFALERPYYDSVMRQNIWLYSESPRIDFDNDIDWFEKHQLVKAAFPLDVHTTRASYDIQFGHVERPTHSNTSWDAAKFEVSAHKWADLSEGNYGVALLNDCKYGYNTEGNVLKITMLKCSMNPNPHADEGKHLFTYSLLPHVGDLSEQVVKEAHLLNQPLSCVPVGKQEGKLPAQFSLVSADKENIIIETVKKAEEDDSMVVRFYESMNQKCVANVQVAAGFGKAYLCDMLENEQEELSFDGKQVTVPVKNFEVVTLKFCKA